MTDIKDWVRDLATGDRFLIFLSFSRDEFSLQAFAIPFALAVSLSSLYITYVAFWLYVGFDSPEEESGLFVSA